MTKYFFAILTTLIFLSETSVGQIADIKTKYKFYKLDSNRSRYLKTGKDIYVITIDSLENRGNNDYSFKTKYTWGGTLNQLNDTSLVLNITSEEIVIANKDSNYFKSNSFVLERPTSIPIDKIKYIQYEPNAGMVFAVIGGLSLLSAIIVAPLASAGYGQKSFNTERYLAIVKPSLVGTAVGLTLHYSFQTRRLQIKPNR